MPEAELLVKVPWFRTGGVIFALLAAGIAGMFWKEPWSSGMIFKIVVVLALGYAALANMFNDSRITLREGWLEVRARPCPWKVVRIPVDDLRGIEVGGDSSEDAVTWRLVALRRSGDPVKLCTAPRGGTDFQGADAVRRTLCTRLGLPLV